MGHAYAVLGAGMQGTAAAYDLLRHGEAGRVVLVDRDPGLLQRAEQRLSALLEGAPVTAAAADAARPGDLSPALNGVRGVLSALPYHLNPGAARAALDAGASFCDLGGNTARVREVLALDAAARERGVSLVPDCGIAPGLANVLAAGGVAALPGARHVRILCGGLPETPRPPLGYRLVFHIGGLTNEYTGEGEYLRDGRIVRVPALSEPEWVEFPAPLGTLEAFVTSGGTSTCPETWAGRLLTYEYKTLRYPGHLEKVRALAGLGLLEEEPVRVGGAAVRPRDVFHAVAAPRLRFPGDPDLLVLRVAVESEDRTRTLRFDLLDRQDPVTGFTAMERCTAFPAAATLHLQVAGAVPPGASTPERCVPAPELLDAVRRRGLDVVESG